MQFSKNHVGIVADWFVFQRARVCEGFSLTKKNKLSLKIKETKLMIFYTPPKNIRNKTLPILLIDNIKLEFVDQFNFLGIIIDKYWYNSQPKKYSTLLFFEIIVFN